jgi:hypothetical protein
MKFVRWIFPAVLAAAIAAASAATVPDPTITVKDLTPKFLAFYGAAQNRHANADERFALWKREYDFAAVPPTPDGEAMARRLLDAAWPRYPGVLARIEKGAAGIEPKPDDTLRRVVVELQPDQAVQIKLLAYVGALDGNAFTTRGNDGVPVVALPVEQSPEERGPIMAHEFTHAVQIAMGSMSGGWVRTIGETALAEGLAAHVAARLYPQRAAASFIEIEPGWLARCDARRRRILEDVRTAAVSDKSEDVMRFTMGTGPAGVEREAYYAGWLVVGHWLRQGMTPAEIARIRERDAPTRVAAAITQMLSERDRGVAEQ